MEVPKLHYNDAPETNEYLLTLHKHNYTQYSILLYLKK